MKPKVKKLMWIAPLAIVGMVVFITLGGTIVMLLWNWLAPALFGLRLITFWEALGLLVLCRILFGGFGLHGSQRSQSDRRVGDRIADRVVDRVAERVAERGANMSTEEQERFRQRLRERWGGGPAGSDTTPL
jgi:uncharacterized membrane protein